MSTSKEESDFVLALRRCVQNAPPGGLQMVCKSLHTLVFKSGAGEGNADKALKSQLKRKQAWFFESINRVVFEHETSALFVGAEIPFGERGTAALSADAAVIDAAAATKASYRAEHVPQCLREGLDDEQSDDAPMFLVLDWSRRRVHVVDPLLQTVLRSCTFTEALPALQQHAAASPTVLAAALNPTLAYILPRQAQLNKAEPRFRNLLALHDALQRSWHISASSRFVDKATIVTGSNIVRVKSKNGEEEEDDAGSSFGISLTLCAERVNKEAFWCARWRSRWLISASADEEAAWSAAGTFLVQYQSSEEGNVTMTATPEPLTLPRLPCSADIHAWITSEAHGEVGATLYAPWIQPMAALTTNKLAASLVELGRTLVRALSKGEDAVQHQIEQAAGPLPAEAAVKALRRKMPVSGQLIQFGAAAAAGGGAGGAAMLTALQQQQQRQAERDAQFE